MLGGETDTRRASILGALAGSAVLLATPGDTFDVVVPYTGLSGTAVYQGDTVERNVNGLMWKIAFSL